MSLTEKAVTKEEAERLGAVPFSFPCRIGTNQVRDETWILTNMIKDLESAGKRWVIVNCIDRNSRSYAKALELWKIN